MADETPPALEDEDAFYRRVSRRLEADTDGPTPSQEAKRLAVLNTMGASKVSEEGEIEDYGGLGTVDYYGDPDLDRRVEEHREKVQARPSTEIRPLKFTDNPMMHLRGKVKSALTSREMDSAREKGLESLEKIGWKEGALPVSAGPIPGIIPWFTNLALRDPKEAAKLFLEVTGSILNPGIDAAISARDLKHAVDTGNVPLGVLAAGGLIIPGYGAAKGIAKTSAKQVAKGAPKIASHFSGAGTMEAALGRHTSVHAAEFDAAAIDAYNKAHGTNYAPKDVLDVDPKEIVGADLYHASPVCKNLSCAKIGRSVDELDQASADKVVQVINEATPPTVSIENVPGYQKTVLFRQITDALDGKGYTWDVGTYNAADFGGAQNRNRMILRATREGELPPIPSQSPPEDWYSLIEDLIDDAPDLPFTSRTTGKDNWEVVRLGQAIDAGILDPSKPILTMGGSASRKIYAANAGGPAPTLTSTPAAVPRIILPDGRVKRLTGRMMARIMGLPDDYPIPETWGQAKKVLGNGIHGSVTEAVIAPLARHGASLGKAPTPQVAKEGAEKVTKEGGESMFDVPPHTVTFDEYLTLFKKDKGQFVPSELERHAQMHRNYVERAISRGTPVPKSVTDAYPGVLDDVIPSDPDLMASPKIDILNSAEAAGLIVMRENTVLPRKQRIDPETGELKFLKKTDKEGNPLPALKPKVEYNEIGEFLEGEHVRRMTELGETPRKLDPRNPEDMSFMINEAAREVAYQMKSAARSGEEWYDATMERAFRLGALKYPELKVSESRRVILTALAAVTSPQTKAAPNFKVALDLYGQLFPAPGKMGRLTGYNPLKPLDPKTGKGTYLSGSRGPNIKTNILYLQHLIDNHGVDETARLLLTPQSFRKIEEAKKASGLVGKSYKVQEVPRGDLDLYELMAYGLGQKVGPFMLNLNGLYEVTADVWLTRTFWRLAGDMFTLKKGQRVLKAAPQGDERALMKEFVEGVAKKTGVKNYQAQSILWFYEQRLYRQLGAMPDSTAFDEGAEMFLKERGISFDDLD